MWQTVVTVIVAILSSGLIQFFFNRHDKNKEILESLQKEVKELRKGQLRLQILNIIQHEPKNKDTILNLYDEYKRLGGNSYIDEVIRKWKFTKPKKEVVK